MKVTSIDDLRKKRNSIFLRKGKDLILDNGQSMHLLTRNLWVAVPEFFPDKYFPVTLAGAKQFLKHGTVVRK
ncbi:hypothetical protein [Leptospira weilii]|uniref:Uncharacterized protein n=1 Tax=Leptospira weilii str. UI 13098 TaxID=1088542 RepID=M6QNX9_9LEPT|nr:hypothetical protein [Leptospira weilii]EMN90562.1 hypothetical protein LEP1GSC108_2823 [Leptospira weilii str. UI 13098]